MWDQLLTLWMDEYAALGRMRWMAAAWCLGLGVCVCVCARCKRAFETCVTGGRQTIHIQRSTVLVYRSSVCFMELKVS